MIDIAMSTVQKIRMLFKKERTIVARKSGGGRQTKLTEMQQQILLDIANANRGKSLSQCYALAQALDPSLPDCDRSTLGRYVRKIKQKAEEQPPARRTRKARAKATPTKATVVVTATADANDAAK